MKIFVAASYSAKVNYDTGEVFPEYKAWLEALIVQIETAGNEVFCSLHEDNYTINNRDPAGAFKLDMSQIDASDAIVALLDDGISAGAQLEVGYALAKGKKTFFVHASEHKLPYVDNAMIQAGLADELQLPLDKAALVRALQHLS